MLCVNARACVRKRTCTCALVCGVHPSTCVRAPSNALSAQQARAHTATATACICSCRMTLSVVHTSSADTSLSAMAPCHVAVDAQGEHFQGHVTGLAASGTLTGIMGMRFIKAGKMMPAGAGTLALIVLPDLICEISRFVTQSRAWHCCQQLTRPGRSWSGLRLLQLTAHGQLQEETKG